MHDAMRRKGERDAARLAEKVREAVRKDIRKYITEEAVITSDGKRKVRIPIRGLQLPEFKFGSNEKGSGRLGSGRGDARDGDRLVPARGAHAAGQGSAEHLLEKEVTIDELVEMAFEELGLPDLEEHAAARIRDRRRRWDEVRKTGPIAQVDLRRTLRANLARRARAGGTGKAPGIGDVQREDLRFRSWTERIEMANNAVIVSMMDVSGSMTEHKKWLVRMCLFWIKRYLERIYDGLAFVFIIHDTRAQIVDEELFFATTTGGGTYISSAYEKALDVVDRDYPAADWNIYPFYFSDGENWEDDNKRAVVHARRLAERSRMFYYGQVASTNYATFMKTITEGLAESGKLVVADIQGEKDVAEAIRRFLARDARLDEPRRGAASRREARARSTSHAAPVQGAAPA